MSLVAPREGEGRRTEWRSGAKRELHGGRDKIWQRAEAEDFLKLDGSGVGDLGHSGLKCPHAIPQGIFIPFQVSSGEASAAEFLHDTALTR
jgi:hypothetical protein